MGKNVPARDIVRVRPYAEPIAAQYEARCSRCSPSFTDPPGAWVEKKQRA